MPLDEERALRHEAMAWLAVQTHDGRDAISRADLAAFEFRGERIDAAHIVEDGHELGIAAVRNGLALCKIHHAAFLKSPSRRSPHLGCPLAH